MAESDKRPRRHRAPGLLARFIDRSRPFGHGRSDGASTSHDGPKQPVDAHQAGSPRIPEWLPQGAEPIAIISLHHDEEGNPKDKPEREWQTAINQYPLTEGPDQQTHHYPRVTEASESDRMSLGRRELNRAAVQIINESPIPLTEPQVLARALKEVPNASFTDSLTMRKTGILNSLSVDEKGLDETVQIVVGSRDVPEDDRDPLTSQLSYGMREDLHAGTRLFFRGAPAKIEE